MPAKLSVNLNAVALLRNRRDLPWPSVVGLGRIAPEPLALTRNFRSSPTIVQFVNRIFAGIFPAVDDPREAAVRYLACEAASARSVGAMPRCVRTNKGSSKLSRSRVSMPLTAGWVSDRRSAARVTLRSSSRASRALSRFKSRFLILVGTIS